MIERTFRIGGSRIRLMEALSILARILIQPKDDYQLTIAPYRKEKSHAQRKLFHKLCAEYGRFLGHTGGQVKEMVKQEHFGIDTLTRKSGERYQVVQSSEEADRMEYSELIETLLRMAAEDGIPLDTQRAA